MTVVAASLKVDHLRKKKLDKILKKKVAQELCAGEGPYVYTILVCPVR